MSNITEKNFQTFQKMFYEAKLKIILKSHDKKLVSFICDSWEIRQNVIAMFLIVEKEVSFGA